MDVLISGREREGRGGTLRVCTRCVLMQYFHDITSREGVGLLFGEETSNKFQSNCHLKFVWRIWCDSFFPFVSVARVERLVWTLHPFGAS